MHSLGLSIPGQQLAHHHQAPAWIQRPTGQTDALMMQGVHANARQHMVLKRYEVA